MPQPLIAGLPPGLDLPAGYVVRVNALDPATGASVSGVIVSNFALYVRNLLATDDTDLQSGPFLLVPGPEA